MNSLCTEVKRRGNKEGGERKIRCQKVKGEGGKKYREWSKPTNRDTPLVLMNSVCKEVKRREARRVKKDKIGCEEGKRVRRRTTGRLKRGKSRESTR